MAKRIATLEEVAEALTALGLTAKRGECLPFLNVWLGDQRSPDDTVWSPDVRAQFHSWAWGPNYEHSMSAYASASAVALAVAGTIRAGGASHG